MCGIVALYQLNGAKTDPADIKRMASVLEHRGPDEAGYAMLEKGQIGFGHVRLSIIDLKTGQQPIFNEDRSVCLIFNGEIYDYHELRNELQDKGHRFRT